MATEVNIPERVKRKDVYIQQDEYDGSLSTLLIFPNNLIVRYTQDIRTSIYKRKKSAVLEILSRKDILDEANFSLRHSREAFRKVKVPETLYYHFLQYFRDIEMGCFCDEVTSHPSIGDISDELTDEELEDTFALDENPFEAAERKAEELNSLGIEAIVTNEFDRGIGYITGYFQKLKNSDPLRN